MTWDRGSISSAGKADSLSYKAQTSPLQQASHFNRKSISACHLTACQGNCITRLGGEGFRYPIFPSSSGFQLTHVQTWMRVIPSAWNQIPVWMYEQRVSGSPMIYFLCGFGLLQLQKRRESNFLILFFRTGRNLFVAESIKGAQSQLR